jgi:hypothetical protein
MAGVVSTSTPPSNNPESTSSPNLMASQTLPSGATTLSNTSAPGGPAQDEQLLHQRHQEQQLMMLQKQAHAQLAQLHQAHAAAAASASATPSVTQHNLAVGAALQSRKEEELNRKDRTLAEFLPMMENYNPIVSSWQHIAHT